MRIFSVNEIGFGSLGVFMVLCFRFVLKWIQIARFFDLEIEVDHAKNNNS